MKTYYVFFSQSMHGLSVDEIESNRQKAIGALLACLGEDVEIIPVNPTERSNAPQNAERLWYLGEAIKDLEKCDFVIFCEGWNNAHACWIEMRTVDEYDIPYIYDADIGAKIKTKEDIDDVLSWSDWRRQNDQETFN